MSVYIPLELTSVISCIEIKIATDLTRDKSYTHLKKIYDNMKTSLYVYLSMQDLR